MNTTKLRSKRVILPTLAAVLALGVGGTVWASAASADVTGGERDRVAQAAVSAAGGGTASEVESSDDPGEAYEVEVRKSDGTDVDVALDKDLKVLTQETDTPDTDTGTDADPAVSATDRASAERAAQGAVSGTVLDVEASNDTGVAFEVEVRDQAGKEWDVDLDSAFKVVRKTEDN